MSKIRRRNFGPGPSSQKLESLDRSLPSDKYDPPSDEIEENTVLEDPREDAQDRKTSSSGKMMRRTK